MPGGKYGGRRVTGTGNFENIVKAGLSEKAAVILGLNHEKEPAV